ncbi:4Fe-4S single cluster domain-containing protein [Actinoplanes siamensis]|uniref:Radical activating enzyme n=1 Tax=Actinoplanes siamensis TaxID=1223317 RepID=A0A919N9J2_9ACTN|nr:4Fe-4S single cluster domain-containing protein [Actinoplanes siamensis]GIF06858.1 radical activating enzyme [Actinoplanes siamensis]
MTESLRLARAHFPVTALGYGRRLGLWVQGCPLACPGCIAKDTWDPDGGVAAGVGELLDDVRRAAEAGADGLTVSGGEPLRQARALGALLNGVREIGLDDFDLLVYTGYELAELDDEQRGTAALADVLITGRYVAAAPTGRIWRGSANQEMLLRTPLARARYTEFLEYEPPAPPIQVGAGPDGRAWWVGVPNRAETRRELDRALAALGYTVESVSWRRTRDR